MFWRTMDPQHPAYDAKAAREYGPVIETTYEMADRLAKMALEAADERHDADRDVGPRVRAVLPILQPERLAGAERLSRRESVRGRETADIFSNADWATTQAYGIGFNAVYLNLRGREAYGAVNESERDGLVQRLSEGLAPGARTRRPGAQMISRVYTRADFAAAISRTARPT